MLEETEIAMRGKLRKYKYFKSRSENKAAKVLGDMKHDLSYRNKIYVRLY